MEHWLYNKKIIDRLAEEDILTLRTAVYSLMKKFEEHRGIA